MKLIIPNPESLPGAVQTVIDQNSQSGPPPMRFINATERGYAENLVEVCQNMIKNPDTFHWLYEDVEKYRPFLSLEDLINLSRHGREWGLDEETVNEAIARADSLDKLRGSMGLPRWSRLCDDT